MTRDKHLTGTGVAVAWLLAAVLLGPARPAEAVDFYVDPVAGDDSRSALLAQFPETPWRTLGHALSLVQAPHRVVALPGEYVEAAQTGHPGVTVRADVPGTAVVRPPAGDTGLRIDHTDVVVEGLVFAGGARGVRATAADGLVIRDCVVVGASTDGIAVIDTSGVTIEGSRAISSGVSGIVLERTTGAYLRSNLVYDNALWGIEIDNSAAGGPQPPLSTGHVLAFNTVAFNGGASGGGVRLHNATGEVRDSVFTENAPFGVKLEVEGSSVHHDLFFQNGTAIDPASYVIGGGLVAADPGFVDPDGADGVIGGIDTWSDDDFSLAQTAAGQAVQSPAVDAGSGTLGSRDIAGTTRSDGVDDAGIADLGFHEGAGASSGLPPIASPLAEYFVDCASGDDARSKVEAQNAATPWRTIRAAAAKLTAGDTLTVAAGTCAESAGIDLDEPDLNVRAAVPGTVTVSLAANETVFNVEEDGVVLEGFVIEAGFQGVLAAKSASGEVLHDVVLRDLVVRPAAASISQNAVQVRDADRVTVENSIIQGAVKRGLLLKRVSDAYVRNNLVYENGEWGIDFDNTADAGGAPPLATGNVAAFNTLYDNYDGLRFNNAEGEIRDNVVVGLTPASRAGIRVTNEGDASYVHHNDSFGYLNEYDLPFSAENSNLSVDPLLVNPAAGDFSLSQTAAGQAVQSPAVDRGSAQVASADIGGSTRTDGAADAGVADMGYHAGAPASPSDPGGSGPMPPPDLATVYVNCATGNDGVSKVQAQLPWSPWQTIAHALDQIVAGETIIVQAGTCPENVNVATADVTLQAESAGAVTIDPPEDSPAVRIRSDGVIVAGFVIESTDEAVRVAASTDDVAVADVVLRDLRIQMEAGSKNGILLHNAIRPVVENSIVLDADESGIRVNTHLQGVDAYIHNNLITGSGDWGVFFTRSMGQPVSTGNVVAFNTVVMNGVGPNEGGISLDGAVGEVRDNIVTHNSGRGIKTNVTPVTIHHNALFGQPTPFDPVTVPLGDARWANVQVDPGFVDAGGADYRLRHIAAGQPSDSPLIDAGSGATAAVDISGSTRTDGVPDAGLADLGFHEGADASTGRPTPAPTPSPTPSPTPPGPPVPGSGDTFYIDPAAGDDSRPPGSAMSPSSPWKTLHHALLQAAPGDVIRLLPGTYNEQADVNDDALTLVGEGPLGSVIIAPPANEAGVNVEGFVDARIENLVVQGGSQGVLAVAADGIRVTSVAVVVPATNGIQIRDTETAWVDSCIVTGAGSDGILLRRTSEAYVRNNLVYANAEWGISVDNSASPPLPPAAGNVLAFNTVHRNEDGIRLLNASGEVRDNQITEHVDLGLYLAGPEIYAHHNNFSGNGRDRDRDSAFASTIFVWAVLGKNPRYVEPDGSDGLMGGLGWADDRFELAQLAAGDEFQSPSVDAGSAGVGTRDISGSTRSDGVPDTGVADPGFHYGAAPADGPPPILPAEGLVFTYYVDATIGDDARTDATARNPATPWRTISHAVGRVEAGAIISVGPGDYIETVQIQTPDLALIAEPAGAAVIRPVGGANAVTVEAPGFAIDGFLLRTGQTGLSALAGSDDLEIRNCVALGSASDGFRVVDSTGVVIEDSRAIGSAFSGILLRRVSDATVRNNLVYDNGEWGVSLDNSPIGGEQLPVSAGNLIAENTIAFNALGNVRFANAVGELRDNLLTDTPGVGFRTDTDGSLLLHNGFARAGTVLDPDDAIICEGCAGNRFTEPLYVAPAGADGIRGGSGFSDDDFRLEQFGAGQSEQSEAVDAGSDDAPVLGATGTTATSGAPDTSTIDLGFHYGANERSPAPPEAPLPEDNLYVDATTGDDARTRAQAANPATPWKTIARALEEATPGDVILIGPGVYSERLRIEVSNLTLRGTGAATAARLATGNRADAIYVRAVGVNLENLWIDGARRGIYAAGTFDGLTVKDVAITSTRREGISLRGGDGVTIDGVTVAGAGTFGVRTSRTADLTLRDCRIYASRRSGLVVARGDAEVTFGTFYANGKEGIRTTNAALVLRDSIVAGNASFGLRVRGTAPVTVDFVHFHANPEHLSPASLAVGAGVAFGLDPLLVDPDGADGVLGGTGWLDDDLSLSQVAGGQAVDSPAVDAGSDLASVLGVSGSTATNGAPDMGQADLGAHR